jgi:hypothetical protein
MRSFLLLGLVVVLTATVSGKPQYGSGGGGGGTPECVTKFRDVHDITTKEEIKRVCKPIVK